MKVVIDTGVFLSALYGGISRNIIDSLDRGALLLCVSKYIVAEYVSVLQRAGADRALIEKVVQYCDEADTVIDTHVTRRFDVGEITSSYKFMECALLTKADYIVTDDPSQLEQEHYDNIQIVTPREFIEIAEHAKRKK